MQESHRSVEAHNNDSNAGVQRKLGAMAHEHLHMERQARNTGRPAPTLPPEYSRTLEELTLRPRDTAEPVPEDDGR